MLEISRDDVIARMNMENRWWADTESIPYLTMQPRPYLKRLVELMTINIRRAVILMGPRRVGKTVMLHHAVRELIASHGVSPKNICLVSVDHPLYNNMSLQRFLDLHRETTGVDYETESCFFIFDEIQYMRDWERHLKVLVDSYPNLKFVASGSAAAALKLKSNESGAGRFTDLLLPPLMFYEYILLKNLGALFTSCCRSDEKNNSMRIIGTEPAKIDEINNHFLDYLNYGGYPEVALSSAIQSDPARFIKSDIVEKVLFRDLPSLYGIENIQELNALFTTLAYNTAGEVSLEHLSGQSGVVKNTIKRYIEYLEAAFLVKTLNRVDANAKRFKRATSFKIYLTNPSIRAALFSPLTANDEKALGNVVETAIFAQWFHSPNDRLLHYARWPQGEIDIVGLNFDMSVGWAAEVKWSDIYRDKLDKLKAQIEFCKRQGLHEMMVTSKTIFSEEERDGVLVQYWPAALYCYVLGHNILKNQLRH